MTMLNLKAIKYSETVKQTREIIQYLVFQGKDYDIPPRCLKSLLDVGNWEKVEDNGFSLLEEIFYNDCAKMTYLPDFFDKNLLENPYQFHKFANNVLTSVSLLLQYDGLNIKEKPDIFLLELRKRAFLKVLLEDLQI